MKFLKKKIINHQGQSEKPVSFWTEMMGNYKYVYFGTIFIVLVVVGLIWYPEAEEKKALDSYGNRLFSLKLPENTEKVREFRAVLSGGGSGDFDCFVAAVLLRTKLKREEIEDYYVKIFYDTPECPKGHKQDGVNTFFGDVEKFEFIDGWGSLRFYTHPKYIFDLKGKKEKGYTYFVVYTFCEDMHGLPTFGL